MKSPILCASERAKGTKYRVQMGTTNKVSGRKVVHSCGICLTQKTTRASVIKQPWKLSEIEQLIKLSTIKQLIRLSKKN